ncbi:MAG: hypothetical protein AB1521_00165 [Bacteroidota bacterium]
MKPIWFFVGLILMIIGVLILLTGLYQLINPPEIKTVLSGTHPGIWWGSVMIVFGLLMYLKNKNQTV